MKSTKGGNVSPKTHKPRKDGSVSPGIHGSLRIHKTGDTNLTTGERIRLVRESLNLTQLEAATLAGVGRPNWSAYEAGRRKLDSIEVLLRIAEALEVTPGWLILELGIGPKFVACNKCNAVRRQTVHPCPECRCPEYRRSPVDLARELAAQAEARTRKKQEAQ